MSSTISIRIASSKTCPMIRRTVIPSRGSPGTGWRITTIWSWSPIDPPAAIWRFLPPTMGPPAGKTFCCWKLPLWPPTARGQNLTRRMIALAMLRIGGIGPVPSVIVACTRYPLCYRIMRETARRFTGGVFFPDLDSAAIDFRAATLAQRIVREIDPNYRLQAQYRDRPRHDGDGRQRLWPVAFDRPADRQPVRPAQANGEPDAGRARSSRWRRSRHS